MSRPGRRIIVGSSIISCALVGAVWLNRSEEPATVEPSQAGPAAPRKVAAPQAPGEVEAAVAAIAPESAAQAVVPPVPAPVLTTEDRGTTRTFEIALDEAVLRGPDGKDVTVRLDPPATLETLRSRLMEIEGEVLPVCYEPGRPHEEIHRRLITRDITVKLPSPDADPVLPAGVVLKEKPDYAPGYAVVSAEDSFAALAALDSLRGARNVEMAEIQLASLRQKRAMPNDPMIGQQWHLKYQGQVGAIAGTDVNVEGAWNYGGAGGVKGSGIRVGIIDDGVDLSHADLLANLDTTNDFDWNGNDATPSPGTGDDHGTACAGNVGARGDNGIGVAGTAPLSTLVGMRLIAAATTDSQEAAAMAHKNDLIFVKSNSWGPSDSGSIVEGPGPLTRQAFSTAATSGRGGLGTIFTWAGGNGLDNGDYSNFDGYANDLHTIAVGAINSKGGQSWYSESGANLLVVAPSNGDSGAGELGITTVDRTATQGYNSATSANGGDYTNTFGGTSSATPTVAGVIALMLEKKPGLGWRDVKEILIRSAAKFNPTDGGWVDNAAGFHFNHKYGAGLVDATAAVDMSATWTNLPPATSKSLAQNGLSIAIPDNNAAGVTRSFTFTGAELRVEQVQVSLTATHQYRGDLELIITSPQGTSSRMAQSRGADNGTSFTGWNFSTPRHWGETSTGTWTVKVADRAAVDTGTLTGLSVRMTGVVINEAPTITAASLTPAAQAYTNQAVSVTGIAATDPESGTLSYDYLWESSEDSQTWTSTGITTATLEAGAVPSGRLVRCQVTVRDATVTGNTITTPSVNLLQIPVTQVQAGSSYSYDSDLVLRNASASAVRDAIVNEFCQGTAANMEWVEILTINHRSFRNWSLEDRDGNLLVFNDSAVWDNIPAGTLILIYQGSPDSGVPAWPANDTNPADGTMVISAANSTYFSGAWPAFVDTGDFVKLNKEGQTYVAGFSFGTSTGGDIHLTAVAADQAAAYRGGNEPDTAILNRWQVSTGRTPLLQNSTTNGTFITALRSGSLSSPSQFRLGATSQTPAGLTIDSTTGVLSGTLTAPVGNYALVIERFNANGEVVSQTFTLTISNLSGYASWIAGFSGLALTGESDDPDGDGMENLLEYYFGSLPGTPDSLAALPVVAKQGNSVTLTWWHLKSATDPEGVPQWSDNLSTWNGSGFNIQTVDETAEKEQLRATLTIGEGDSRRFLRLKVD